MLDNAFSLVSISFFTSLLMLPALRIVALAGGLTDKPSSRKQHKGEIPLVGGIAIFIGFVLTWIFVDQSNSVLHFLLLAAPLVLVGILDDLHEVSPLVRIAVQIGVSIGMIQFSGIQINQIGDILGQGPVLLEPIVAKLFTIFCVVGVINAVNMLDGCDGLAGSVSLITIFTLGGLAGINGDGVSFVVAIMLAGGLVAFLLFNTHFLAKDTVYSWEILAACF